MKNRIFKSFIFVFAVTALSFLFVFSSSAKEVKKNGFTFDVQKDGVTVVEYKGTAKRVKIPAKVNGVAVKRIENYCFWQIRTMTTLSIPANVTEIGEGAFNECTALKKVVLPKKLEKLGASAFWFCSNLETVVLDSQVKQIGKDAFRGCGKLKVYVVSGTYGEKHLKGLKTVNYGLTYPTEVSIRKSLRMDSGKTVTLKVTASPSGTYYSALSIATSNKAIADVSPEGIVSSFKCGTAVITASVKGNEKVFAKCKVTVKPSKPADLKQTGCTVSSASLSWAKADGATEYKLTRYDAAKKKWVELGTTDKTTFTVKSLKKGESVKVRVRSIFKSGKVLIAGGISSVTVSARNNSPVKSLKQTGSAVDSVTVSWKALAGAQKYRVILLSSKGEQLQKTESEKTECTLSGLSASTSYKVRVRAVFKNGSKSYVGKISEIQVKTLTPSKISSVRLSNVTDSGITFTWDKLNGASKYYIYIYSEEKKSYVLLNSTYQTSFALTELDPESEVKIRICAAFFKTNGSILLGPGFDTSAKTASRPIPKTNEEALSNFVKAFNNVSAQKNFSLFETKSVKDAAVLPSSEKFQKLLSSVDNSGKTDYTFVNGTETGMRLSLSQIFPSMNGKLSLSEEDAKNCTVDYRGDGNGFFIEITLPASKAENALLNSFASLPDWETIGKDNGVSFTNVEYGKAVISAKVNGGRLDTLSLSVPLTASGTDGKTVFTIGETLEREYIFLWN